MDWHYAIKVAETVDEEILNAIFYKYSNNMANTYVFTKHIAECMVDDYKDVLPVVIYRPSVVTSAEKEPLPGFIDSFNGHSLIFLHFSFVFSLNTIKLFYRSRWTSCRYINWC